MFDLTSIITAVSLLASSDTMAALSLLWQAMLSIFLVMLVIFLIVWLMNYIGVVRQRKRDQAEAEASSQQASQDNEHNNQ